VIVGCGEPAGQLIGGDERDGGDPMTADTPTLVTFGDWVASFNLHHYR